MNTLPSISTTPWIKQNKENSTTPRVTQGSLDHHRTKAKDVHIKTHVDTEVFKNKNDFAYEMYMLSRKFRRVEKDVVDHYGQFQKTSKGTSSPGRDGKLGTGDDSRRKERAARGKRPPVPRPEVADTRESRRSSGSDASSVF